MNYNLLENIFLPSAILVLGAIILSKFRKNFLTSKIIFFFICFISGVNIIFDVNIFYYSDYDVEILQLTFLFILFFSGIFALNHNRIDEIISGIIYAAAAIALTVTTNILIFFCLIEVMMISASYIIFKGHTKASHAAGLRYLKMHIIAGILILLGIMVHYETFGSFNFCSNMLYKIDMGDLSTYKHGFLALGLLINAAIFPFSAWLADSYPKASTSGSLLLSVFTTKLSLLWISRIYWESTAFIYLGIITLSYAGLYMVLENNFRKMTAYFIILQNAILLVAIGLGGKLLKNNYIIMLSLSSVYCFFLMYVASYLAEKKSIEHFVDLKIRNNFKNALWPLSLGFLPVIGVPYTVSYIIKYFILKSTSLPFVIKVINYSVIPVVIATYGKLLGYFKYHRCNGRFNFVGQSKYYSNCGTLLLLGMLASEVLSVEYSLGLIIEKFLYILIPLIVAILLFKLIENKNYQLTLDIDWVYRRLLFKCYQFLAYPLIKLADFYLNYKHEFLNKLLGLYQILFSDKGFFKKCRSISWIITIFLICMITIYYY